MNRSLLNYQTDRYSYQTNPATIWKDELSFSLIPLPKCNLDTFLKTIYMKKTNSFLKVYEYSGEFKSFPFKLDYERFRTFILNITPSDVAIVLKQIRIQQGYSLEQLARLTAFSKSSISHRESITSLTFPNLKTIQKYLDSCNLTFFQFMVLIFLQVMIG